MFSYSRKIFVHILIFFLNWSLVFKNKISFYFYFLRNLHTEDISLFMSTSCVHYERQQQHGMQMMCARALFFQVIIPLTLFLTYFFVCLVNMFLMTEWTMERRMDDRLIIFYYRVSIYHIEFLNKSALKYASHVHFCRQSVKHKISIKIHPLFIILPSLWRQAQGKKTLFLFLIKTHSHITAQKIRLAYRFLDERLTRVWPAVSWPSYSSSFSKPEWKGRQEWLVMWEDNHDV